MKTLFVSALIAVIFIAAPAQAGDRVRFGFESTPFNYPSTVFSPEMFGKSFAFDRGNVDPDHVAYSVFDYADRAPNAFIEIFYTSPRPAAHLFVFTRDNNDPGYKNGEKIQFQGGGAGKLSFRKKPLRGFVDVRIAGRFWISASYDRGREIVLDYNSFNDFASVYNFRHLGDYLWALNLRREFVVENKSFNFTNATGGLALKYEFVSKRVSASLAIGADATRFTRRTTGETNNYEYDIFIPQDYSSAPLESHRKHAGATKINETTRLVKARGWIGASGDFRLFGPLNIRADTKFFLVGPDAITFNNDTLVRTVPLTVTLPRGQIWFGLAAKF